MTDPLDVLLIEDNPGDARLIEEMLHDAEELFRRVDAGDTGVDSPALRRATTLSEGLAEIDEQRPDVVLLDLGLPDSTGLETLDAVVEESELLPIVVLTGLDDRGLGIEAIQRGAEEYLTKDEATGDGLVRSIHYAIERTRNVREREQRRRQLEALHRLNGIVQDVTHAVITTATREELERTVCDRLVAPDGYRFAWIGEVDRGTGEVAARVSAGVEEGYLEEVAITVDDTETAEGPTGRAIETGEVQVVADVETDPSFDPWREAAVERGYRSTAAIPIVYEELTYGVVSLYAAEPDAFSDSEIEILSGLGDVVGHAIAATERKAALMSDVVLELEFQADELTPGLRTFTAESDATIEIDTLLQGDEELVAYGTATDVAEDELRDAVTDVESVGDLRILSAEDEELEIEFVFRAAQDLFQSVATHGGSIQSATISDGTLRFVGAFPRGRDPRQLVALVQDHCPSAELVAQRTVQRHAGTIAELQTVLEHLTDRQRAAIETAFRAGYFDWPRASSGEDVADRLGIAPATFSQHLRTAEQKVFGAMFEADEAPDDTDEA